MVPWQDDVNAAMVNAWPFCNILVAGPSCLTEPSVPETSTLKVMPNFGSTAKGVLTPELRGNNRV